jgi:hypothetical protein
MKQPTPGRLGALLLTLALAAPLPAAAHHGWGGYSDTQSQITGALVGAVKVNNPHATAQIRTADGQVWDVVLAPPSRTERAGLTTDVIPAGAQVTAHGHRHRDAKKLEIKTERLTWNGRTFDVYPDRN